MSSDHSNQGGHNSGIDQPLKPRLSLVKNTNPKTNGSFEPDQTGHSASEGATTSSLHISSQKMPSKHSSANKDTEPHAVVSDATETDKNADQASHDQTSGEEQLPSNVVNLFTGLSPVSSVDTTKIVRIVPETSGIRMLYANADQPDRLIAVPILCWGLDDTGNITGLVPWLDEILPCEAVAEKYNVLWEGYYDIENEDIFFEADEETVARLTLAARFETHTNRAIVVDNEEKAITQEVADPVGTHALLLTSSNDSLLLTSVVSWVLDEDGVIHGMLADDNAIEKLPVLPGDNCLYSADQVDNFRCFFQRDIAEQIRTQNPETLEAIEQLFAN